MEKTTQIKKLEKTVRMTRLSSILFLGVLVVGSLLDIPLNILAPVVVAGAVALVVFIGIPTQKKLFILRKEIVQERSDGDE